MHVGTAVEEPDLRIVPPAVAVVADMQGLVEIADQVDEEPERLAPFLDRSGRVLQGRTELPDLADDASLLGARA